MILVQKRKNGTFLPLCSKCKTIGVDNKAGLCEPCQMRPCRVCRKDFNPSKRQPKKQHLSVCRVCETKPNLYGDIA